MAKKAAAKPAKDDGGDVKPSEVREAISAKKLSALLKAGRAAKQDIAEISGTFGQAVANAVENNHLHRRAFRIVQQLDRLEPEKLAETLDHLEHYLEVSGLYKRAETVQRLQMGEDDDGGPKGEDDEAPARDANVRRFPPPA